MRKIFIWSKKEQEKQIQELSKLWSYQFDFNNKLLFFNISGFLSYSGANENII